MHRRRPGGSLLRCGLRKLVAALKHPERVARSEDSILARIGSDAASAPEDWMPRHSLRRSTLRRLAGESLAIFVGVAAALAGQAWFEARSAHATEREFLESILQELNEVSEFVDNVAAHFGQQRTAAVGLAYLLSRPMNASRADSVLDLTTRLTTYTTGQGLAPAEALLAPEPLRVIQDASLRSELARFRYDIIGMRVALETNANFMLSEWRAFGIEHFDYRFNGGFWSDAPEAPPVSRHARDGNRIAESPEFENLLDILIVQQGNVLLAVDEMPARISEVRELISRRLEDL